MGQFLNLLDAAFEGEGKYDIPRIMPVTDLYIKDWVGINYAVTTKKQRELTGVHFFVDDYQFERVWNFPERFSQVLDTFGCVLTPDFSLYFDFPMAIQIFNHYRKHWCGAYWQSKGVTVIPTIRWGLEDSYEWCFDGEPKESIVAVSNVGCMRSAEYRKLFMQGYKEMLSRLQPKEVLMYGHIFDDYPGPVHYIHYQQAKGEQGEE